MKILPVILLGALCVQGCTKEPGSTTLTKGKLVVECDETVYPVMQREVVEFRNEYTSAELTLRPVDGQEAIVNFINDSIRVIITARPFNKEELGVIAQAKIQYQEYRVAMSAVAVIAHKSAPVTQLRTGQVDSMFGGDITRWPGGERKPIDAVVGGPNASTNEVLRTRLMGGRKFGLAVTPMASSADIVDYVAKTPGAIGLVGVGWLKGFAERLSVLPIGGPTWRPDTTKPAGQYYEPAQAYVFQGYYPLDTPVFIYTRETSRDLGLGFIAFVTSAPGQKVVLNGGLVPVTMPVKLVQLTSEQVK